MLRRRRFKQITSLDQRLADHADRLRTEAQVAEGIERERLADLARQADAAVEMANLLKPQRVSS